MTKTRTVASRGLSIRKATRLSSGNRNRQRRTEGDVPAYRDRWDASRLEDAMPLARAFFSLSDRAHLIGPVRRFREDLACAVDKRLVGIGISLQAIHQPRSDIP